MPRETYHSHVLRSYMMHMVMRDLINPSDPVDFSSTLDKLTVDIQTLSAIRNTRYPRTRGHVAKAGNLHLAWVYAGILMTTGGSSTCCRSLHTFPCSTGPHK
jgi:hypothetical protein